MADNAQDNNVKLTRDELFRLYEISIQQEQYFLTEHQNRIAFYVGLLTALIGGTVAGLFYAQEWYHFAAISAGPLVMVAVVWIGKKGAERLYQRFLEAITMLAKIEADLGLTETRNSTQFMNVAEWVKKEPYVTKRHLESRGDECSSKEWVKAHLTKMENYHGIAERLFNLARTTALCGLCFIVIIWLIESLRYFIPRIMEFANKIIH